MLRGELRAVQPGRADRRARPVPPRRDPDHDDGLRSGDRRLHDASSRWSIPESTCSSIPRRARRAPTSTPIGVDREVGRRLAVAVAYVRKDGSQLHRLDRCRRSVSRGDADVARRPQPCRCSCSSTPPAARRFLLTNPDGYSLTYNGLVMVVEKRRSDGWQAFGSYTLSRAYGLQASSGTTAAGAQVSTVAGADPADVRAAIRTISPTRAAGCRTIARTCSGSWAASTCHGPAWWSPPTCSISAASRGRRRRRSRCRRASQRVLLEPRGSRRLSSQSLLDLRVSRTIRLRRRGTHRAAPGRAQCAQRHGGGRAGDRQSVQPEFRSGHRLHGSASRDGRREAEPGPVSVFSRVRYATASAITR